MTSYSGEPMFKGIKKNMKTICEKDFALKNKSGKLETYYLSNESEFLNRCLNELSNENDALELRIERLETRLMNIFEKASDELSRE